MKKMECEWIYSCVCIHTEASLPPKMGGLTHHTLDIGSQPSIIAVLCDGAVSPSAEEGGQPVTATRAQSDGRIVDRNIQTPASQPVSQPDKESRFHIPSQQSSQTPHTHSFFSQESHSQRDFYIN